MNGYAFKILDKDTLNPLAFGCGMTEEHRTEMIQDTTSLCSVLLTADQLEVVKSEITDYDGGFGVWWITRLTKEVK